MKYGYHILNAIANPSEYFNTKKGGKKKVGIGEDLLHGWVEAHNVPDDAADELYTLVELILKTETDTAYNEGALE